MSYGNARVKPTIATSLHFNQCLANDSQGEPLWLPNPSKALSKVLDERIHFSEKLN